MKQSWAQRNLSKLIIIPLIIIFGGLSAWLTWDTYSFEKASRKAVGEVVEIVPGRSKRTFKPVIVFKTANGDSVKFESAHASNPPSYEIGEKVPVKYLPDEPDNAQIDSWPWLFPLILWAITIAITAGAIAMGAFKKTENSEIQYF
jgi:hypothetical protein